ncbi:MAG: hypothetical protein HUK20_09125 [Fibrobacter sp.]|nr:hypothetical protein [Fibrobacter sp.]
MKKILFALLCLCSLAFSQEGNVSRREMAFRNRDILLDALKSRDSLKATEAFEYLRENVENGAPLQQFEEYLCLFELGRFDEAVEVYADVRRQLLDSSYAPKFNERVKENDGLLLYLVNLHDPFDLAHGDSLIALVKESSIDQEKKDLYETLIYAELGLGNRYGRVPVNGQDSTEIQDIKDTTIAKMFLSKAKKLAYNYPLSEHTMYLKGQVVPRVENTLRLITTAKNNPEKFKYYTGGLGVYYSGWTGSLAGEASDYYKADVRDGSYLEFHLQFRRVALDLFSWDGMRIEGEDAVHGIGASLGYVVYDSRFFRVTPFGGLSSVYWFDDCTVDDIDGFNDQTNYIVFNVGVNADIRLWTFRSIDFMGVFNPTILLRFKYVAEIGNAEFIDRANFSYSIHKLSMGIGIELW